MQNLKHILKTGLAAAFVATIAVSCGERPKSNPTDDTSTSEAITERSKSTQNLNKPRPAPIGRTAETGEQADRFGNIPPNVDSVARAKVELDRQRQLEENPNQRPRPRTPQGRRVEGGQTGQ
ncbi:hypothetical protein H9Q13_15690 [Pontibacter sp. JH31]|uniref:Lipoprotein n=1 Tax=Pontibacter aquaedesilientis TaxID=2766980 RepID=A0ABR7XK01_9BACT|nr:hypothetical protein [Pontibacter aquaedesilientis]MBD1398615.1 hypothetical protein [Pontibacter aquaedesilientis]